MFREDSHLRDCAGKKRMSVSEIGDLNLRLFIVHFIVSMLVNHPNLLYPSVGHAAGMCLVLNSRHPTL